MSLWVFVAYDVIAMTPRNFLSTCALSLSGERSCFRRAEVQRHDAEWKPPARTPVEGRQRHVGTHSDECTNDDVTRSLRIGYTDAQPSTATAPTTTTRTTKQQQQQPETSDVTNIGV